MILVAAMTNYVEWPFTDSVGKYLEKSRLA